VAGCRPKRRGDGQVGVFVAQFCVQVPTGQLEGGRGRCPVPVAAGLLIGERTCQNGGRVDPSRGIQQRIGGSGSQARDHPVAKDPALGEPADRIEGQPGHGPSGPDHVGAHRDQRHGVAGEVHDRVGGAAA
jgi:hypothetical protein